MRRKKRALSKTGFTQKVIDWGAEKVAGAVGGTPAERTKAFLQALESSNLKKTVPANMTRKVTTPAKGLITNPTKTAIKKSSNVMAETIPQKVKGATKIVDKSKN